MREKTPQDYANELLQMYRANAVAPTQNTIPPDEVSQMPTEAPEQTAEPSLNQLVFEDGTGGLAVNVTTLRRLYPVKGATVTVFTGEIASPTVIETDITDESGKSGVFNLKTPVKAESQQAENGGALPYASYNISVKSDGYVEQIAMNVPVFSGVISVQGIDLIPIAAAGGHTDPQIIQEGNNYNL
ncbi:MAG: hypothetical protein IJZ21_00280 [Clostridia bacterium]|nr:hypothetical protein [Clostridia bacterium]